MTLPQRADVIANQLKDELEKQILRVINLPLVRERCAMAPDGLSEMEREELISMVLRRVG